jgi:hypothetical protein
VFMLPILFSLAAPLPIPRPTTEEFSVGLWEGTWGDSNRMLTIVNGVGKLVAFYQVFGKLPVGVTRIEERVEWDNTPIRFIPGDAPGECEVRVGDINGKPSDPYPGIYRWEKDELVIYLGSRKGKRPRDFIELPTHGIMRLRRVPVPGHNTGVSRH